MTVYSVFSNGMVEKIKIEEDFSNVTIDIDNVYLKVTTTNKLQDIKVELENGNNKFDVNAMVIDDSLEIEVDRKGFRFIFLGFSKTPILNVVLPEELAGDIVVDSNNGTVEVTNLQAKGIYAETENGKVLLNNTKSEAVYGKSSNGKLIFDNIDGKLNGETSNGSISLLTDELNQSVNFESHNGSIVIETNKEPKNVMIKVETNNGEVNVFDKHNREMTFGDGDNIVDLVTNNGSITVR